jgi:hypothetical protein
MSGSAAERVAVVIASARSLPNLMSAIDEGAEANMTSTCAPSTPVSAGPAPRKGTWTMSMPAPHLQQFAGKVTPASVARRSQIDLARIGLGTGDELGNRLSWNRWIDHHHQRPADDTCNRCDVTDEVEVELLVEGRVDRAR